MLGGTPSPPEEVVTITGSPFTAQEWQALRLAPFWILSAVVGRDRDFTEPDRVAFAVAVARARATTSDPLTTSVLDACTGRFDLLLAEYEEDERSVGSGLHDVAGILARTADDHGAAFRDALVRTIGVSLATARGPYGRTATVEDLQRLRLAAALMTADEPGAARSGLARTAGVA
ncbi:hypothetical protein BN12_3870002 [Nostocoides japonicum T1-X7]|uniref:Uncharacterized protein n=1 Tax=Nostocoides japonicum T1-X7 TaxID=1194083 RepID=A0A077M4B3_9MICO|nr:hypothetical protein [Tetrasphaera japonica]CCH78965.1 hypothetical protein BN12_3870002 [Tetrasphaera japonica T1-X7]